MNNFLLFILLGIILYGTSCQSDSNKIIANNDLDNLVSEHFLDDSPTLEATQKEAPPLKVKVKPPIKKTRLVNNRNSTSSDLIVANKKKNKRNGQQPDDFAEAITYAAIRMVYSDKILTPKTKILQSKIEKGQHIIDMRITWKDHWTPKYELKGKLTVDNNGENAIFIITEKNINVEALEFTEDNFKNKLSIGHI